MFFRSLYALTKGGYVELRAIANDKLSPPRRAFVQTAPEVAAFAEKYGQRDSKYGVYFGICKREIEGDGTKKSIRRVPALWVDLDTVKNGWDTDEVLQRIHAIDGVLRPTACVRSGGGLHLYWFLNGQDKHLDMSVIEAANTTLRNVFAGDAVQNVDRIFRLPGTWNTKRKPAKRVEVAWCYDFERLDFQELDYAACHAKKWIGAWGDWADRRAVRTAAVEDREPSDPTDAFAALYGEGTRGMTKNLTDMWASRVRYKAPRGYIGIHEAALRHTAILYIANKAMPDKAIVDLVMKEIEAVKSRDAPDEDWDMAREAATVLGMVQTWKPKWSAYVNAAKREKKRSGVGKNGKRAA